MKFKKIICSVLIATSVFSSFATTAFAANTSDEHIAVVWAYSQPSFQLIKNYDRKDSEPLASSYHKKENSSKVFFKMGGSGYLDVKACAVTPAGIQNHGSHFLSSEAINYTYNPSTGTLVSYARCTPNKNYGISSLIYENALSYQGHKYATLKVRSSSTVYGTGEGWWSPDSSQTHNTPTYYNS